MKSASNARSSEQPDNSSAVTSLPEVPLNDLTAGVNWARDDRALCILDGRGRKVTTAIVEHTNAGLRELIDTLGKHGVGEVAIERPDGPVVDTRLVNPWATGLYDRARARGHDHAVRILARAWLHIIWHCWQDHRAYDPTQHRALQRLLATQTAAA